MDRRAIRKLEYGPLGGKKLRSKRRKERNSNDQKGFGKVFLKSKL